MIARIDAAFKAHRSVMVQMPTGTGKTYLLASVVFKELGKSDAANVWICAHSDLPFHNSYRLSAKMLIYNTLNTKIESAHFND
jgi:Rad3-related DNA helicase